MKNNNKWDTKCHGYENNSPKEALGRLTYTHINEHSADINCENLWKSTAWKKAWFEQDLKIWDYIFYTDTIMGARVFTSFKQPWAIKFITWFAMNGLWKEKVLDKLCLQKLTQNFMFIHILNIQESSGSG
jgi:hypothetical protein